MEVVTIVLAGGLGRRLGVPKLRLQLGGIPLYLRALRTPTRKLFVTRRHMVPRLPPDVEPVIDRGLGPVEALRKALERVSEDIVVIKPVDMPFLDRETVSGYISGDVVVFASDRIHRVAAIRPSEKLRVAVKNAARMRDLYREYRVARLDGCRGLNINTLEDLLLGLECLEKRRGGVRGLTQREP